MISLSERFPASVRERLSPSAVLLAVHGIVAGVTTCTACDQVITTDDYPGDRCRHCARPYPRRCARPDCVVEGGGLSQPRPHRDETRRIVAWTPPYPECHACEERAEVDMRRAQLERWIPPRELTLADNEHYDGKLAHRRPLAAELWRWYQGLGTNERPEGWRPVIWAWGGTGAGKSVALARAARRAIEHGAVRTLCWVRERPLIEAAKTHWQDDPDTVALYDGGPELLPRQLLAEARSADLLVIDELLSHGAEPYLSAGGEHLKAADVVGGILYDRFDSGRPTLIASNRCFEERIEGHTPGKTRLVRHISAAFDSRVESRFMEAGLAVAVPSPDMRLEHSQVRA